MSSCPQILGIVSVLTLPLAAQRLETVAITGDTLPSGDRIGNFDNLWVGDDGEWFVRGQLEGESAFYGLGSRGGELPNQTGAPTWEFDTAGNRVQLVTGSDTHEGLFWNEVELIREISTLNLPGEPYLQTFRAFRVLEDRSILVFAKLNYAGDRRDSILRLVVDDAGVLADIELLLQEGDPLPLPGATFLRFSWILFDEHTVGTGRPRDFAWFAASEQGDSLLLRGLDEVIAKRGTGFIDPSDPAVDGRRILNFDPLRADLNDFGEHAYLCRLSVEVPQDASSFELLVKNAAKVAQLGDALPSLNGDLLDRFPDSPVYISNAGDVYWGARIQGVASSNDSAWMRNRDVVVREGETLVEGNLVARIDTNERGFRISPDGRYWIGRMRLAGIGQAVVMADFGLAVPFPGRDQNTADLRRVAGDPILGTSMTLRLEGGQSPGELTALLFSPRSAIPGSSFGIQTPFGELLIGPVSGIVVGPTSSGAPVDFALNVPANMALFDTEWFAQGIYLDASPPSLQGRLSNAMRFEIAAP